MTTEIAQFPYEHIADPASVNMDARKLARVAPFDGDLMGVKLGDDDKKLIANVGNPITKPTSAFVTMQAYKYVWDDSAYVTFDLNDDGVQCIFITK